MWLFETQHLLVVPLHEPRQQRCRVTTGTRCVLYVSVVHLCTTVCCVFSLRVLPGNMCFLLQILRCLQQFSRVPPRWIYVHSTTVWTSSTRVSCGTRCVVYMSFVDLDVVFYFTFVWFVFLILGFWGEQGINWLFRSCQDQTNDLFVNWMESNGKKIL